MIRKTRSMATPIDGGITAPLGFRAAGLACGIKSSGKPDLAIVAADRAVPAAAIFTTNQAKAAPVLVSQEHLAWSDGHWRRSSSPTAAAPTPAPARRAWPTRARWPCSPPIGIGCAPSHALVASTGVIGVNLKMDAVRDTAFPRPSPRCRRDGHAEPRPKPS